MEFLADQYSSRDARKSVWLSRLRTLNGWFSDYYTLPGIHITDNDFYDKIYVPFGEWDVHEDTIQDIVMSCKTIDLTVNRWPGYSSICSNTSSPVNPQKPLKPCELWRQCWNKCSMYMSNPIQNGLKERTPPQCLPSRTLPLSITGSHLNQNFFNGK
eukprot:705015_1